MSNSKYTEEFESVYNNIPRFGLAKVMECVPATGKYKTAKDRLSQ